MRDRNMLKKLIGYSPMPSCAIDEKGVIIAADERFSKIFNIEDAEGLDVQCLLNLKLKQIQMDDPEKGLKFVCNNNFYKVLVTKMAEEDGAYIIVSMKDVTAFKNLKDLYNDGRDVIAIVNIDNYEELYQGTSEENRAVLFSTIDKVIRNWGIKIEASVTKYTNSRYLMVFSHQQLECLTESKFAILDEVRAIETETDFPVTLSIGVGVGGKTPAQTDGYAVEVLDLALGRGGDQAVVKRINKIEYYGGKTQAVEKTNKGKSRVVAHALLTLVNQSSKVFIMGHKNPDMDSFGASLGIFRYCDSRYSEAYIIINDYNETLEDMVNLAKKSGSYNFLTNEEALAIADKDTLVIIVDFHRPALADCPELLTKTDRIAIIDHHRRAADCVENPVLMYLEPYASSTAELVSEILRYTGDRKNVDKLEAEAMLAGITMDTNRFSVKTGVRTFEAASWLRRQGADTTEVKRFFQTDMKLFKLKAKCISEADITESGEALSVCEGEHSNAQILTSQIADELLSIKGVKASFVAGRDNFGCTMVSARSLGEVNVQSIMEKVGGGGHLTTAGAQLKISPEEAIFKLNEILKEEKI